LQLFAAQFGKAKIKLFLTKSGSNTLLKSWCMHACTVMSYWTGLYNATIQEHITRGVETMLAIAYRLLAL
jgi:hypothetical protein